MATHFGGVGDTSMENPDTQDRDNISEDMLLKMKMLFRDCFARQNI